jgi:hypothetical protein
LLCNQLLQSLVLSPDLTHFLRTSFPDCISGQPLFPGFKKRFAPFVVDTRIDPFSAAKTRDALLTPKPFKDYTNLLLRSILAAGLPLDLPYNGFRRWLLLGTHVVLLA